MCLIIIIIDTVIIFNLESKLVDFLAINIYKFIVVNKCPVLFIQLNKTYNNKKYSCVPDILTFAFINMNNTQMKKTKPLLLYCTVTET